VSTLADGQCGLTDGSSGGDWRIPTKEEWETFMCREYTSPAVCNTVGTGQWSEGDPYINVETSYWSSIPTNDITHIWAVHLTNGLMYSLVRSDVSRVWPVRRRTF